MTRHLAHLKLLFFFGLTTNDVEASKAWKRPYHVETAAGSRDIDDHFSFFTLIKPSPMKRASVVAPKFPTQTPKFEAIRLTLLLGDTNGPATTASGLGVLSTDAQAPVVSESTVSTNLLEPL